MTFLHFLMSAPRVSIWVGVGGKSEEWPCAGLRWIEGPFWVDSSPCSRILITKLWDSPPLLCFFSWGPSVQELAQSQVVLEKVLLTWSVTTISRLETDCLVERTFIHRLLWSWSKPSQLCRKFSRERKLDRQNFKFNGWLFKTREIAPTISSNSQHSTWFPIKKVRQY